MCGILGEFLWHSSAQPLPLLPLSHRGPDSQGIWLSHDKHCWLGHTRLAILDASTAGAQPMTSHCGRFTIVFNGEIYNHQEVRGGLRFQNWRGHSDSETLVEGLAQRGPALVLELRGMFAFAAYNHEKQQLLLCRDRLGIKPLYLQWIKGGLRFSSERRALTGHQRIPVQDISSLISFGHLQTPATLSPAEDGALVTLPPGLLVRINRTRSHDPVRYWPPQPRPDWTPLPIRNYGSASQLLRRQLELTVEQHLQADVPIASFLSSGLDSGIITALACRIKPGCITTITVSFPGDPNDESEQAMKMAQHCGSDHHSLVLQEDQVLDWIVAGLTGLDVPSVDALNTYIVSRAVVQQGIKVALTGLGADELFGGYISHRIVPYLHHLRLLPPGLRNRLLQTLTPTLAAKLDNLPRWDCWHLTVAMRRWVTDQGLAAAGLPPLHWPDQPTQRITQVWGQISWAELFAYTEPMLLRDSDNMSMLSGLELRVPFLDHRIVEIALRIPQRFQQVPKRLLKAACADLFPSGYITHTRKGFSLPMRDWMLDPLRGTCLQRLDALLSQGLLNPDWIRQEWQEFEMNQQHWTRAWRLVILGEWVLREQQQ